MVSGGYGGGDIPVPIPNTAVKPTSADGTWGFLPGRVGRRRDFLKAPHIRGGPSLCPHIRARVIVRLVRKGHSVRNRTRVLRQARKPRVILRNRRPRLLRRNGVFS